MGGVGTPSPVAAFEASKATGEEPPKSEERVMGEAVPRAMIESVRPEFFIEFLESFRASCAAHGVSLDRDEARKDPDAFYEAVYRFFNEPSAAKPPALGAALEAIVHLAEDDAHESLRASLTKFGVSLSGFAEMTPPELALHAYEKHANAFACAIERKRASAKQRLWEYIPRDRRALGSPSSAETKTALLTRLRHRHGELGHTYYAGIKVTETADETRIFWFHGRGAQARPVIRSDNERELQRMVYERCDVTTVDRVTGRLSISAINPAQVDFLRQTLGAVFFADANHYAAAEIYTGAPLLERGRASLSVEGLPALRRVALRALSLDWEGPETYVSPGRNTCLFDTKPARMREAQRAASAMVTTMKLLFEFTNGRQKTLEIVIPNRMNIERSMFELPTRGFLTLRGFAVGGHGLDDWRLAA
jgi:hypothetical protein